MNLAHRILTVLVLCTPLVFQTIYAQEAQNEGSVLEEVQVTAQKRVQSMQDVGIAVSAFSGAQLEALGFQDSTDIAAMTPGVHISGALGGQLQTFTIRGVAQSDFIETAESPNAIYIDDAYVGYMSAARFAMYDLERVEILKGPQGTLFGRNATGGLVHYLSKRPTQETEAYADLTYGSYNQIRVETALGGSFSDSIRGRIAGYFNKHDGVIKNSFPGGSDLGNDDTQALRAMLEFDLGDTTTLLLKGEFGRSELASAPYQSVATTAIVDVNGHFVDTIYTEPDDDRLGIGPNGENVCPGCLTANPTRPVPGGDFNGGVTTNQATRTISPEFSDDDSNFLDSDAFTARLETEFANGIDLVSVTDYREHKKETFFDNDGFPYHHLVSFFFTENEQLSQEIRISGETENTHWTSGLYYLDYKTEVESGFFSSISDNPEDLLENPLIPLGLAGLWFENRPDLETTSYSVFGQVEYDFTDQFSLVVGVRLIREEKDYSHGAGLYLEDGNDRGDFLAVLEPTQTFRSDDDLWSGKLQVEWRPDDDILLYGGVNRGIKAGSFNQDYGGLAGGLGVAIPASYDEEVLIAYEVGFKNTLMNGHARLNAAVYYYDYQDFQAFRYSGLSFFVTNSDATSKGAEIDFMISPVDGLEIGLSAAYIDFLVKDVVFDTGVRDVEAPYVPKFQASGLVRYSWEALSGLMSLQLNGTHSDSFFVSATNFTSTKFPSYTLLDLRLSYETPDGKWRAAVFGKNITDEFYKVVGFDLTNLWGAQQYVLGSPDWYGVSLRYNF